MALVMDTDNRFVQNISLKGITFRKPSEIECRTMLSGCQQIEENLFVASSNTDTDEKYMVEIAVDLLECEVGVSRSPCRICSTGS